MTTTRVVADLLRTDLVWRRFFKRCCALGAFRLRAQAWQFRVALAERGVMADLEDVQDVLHMLASKTLPASPAGRPLGDRGNRNRTPGVHRGPRLLRRARPKGRGGVSPVAFRWERRLRRFHRLPWAVPATTGTAGMTSKNCKKEGVGIAPA